MSTQLQERIKRTLNASASFMLDRYGHVTKTMKKSSADNMGKYYEEVRDIGK